jgi:hypothetical protein
MDIMKFLTEMSKSTNPQALTDSYFKKENSDPQPDPELLSTEIYNHMISVLTKFDEPWMTDQDRVEAKEMAITEIERKGVLSDMRNAIKDGINRNYDMNRYGEFMKIVTTMMSK